VPSLAPAFDQLVERAMAKDPAARFQNAHELARALLPFVGERTRMNYAHELTGAGVQPTQAISAPAPERSPSTLDPSESAVALDGRRGAFPLRAIVLVLAALAALMGVLVYVRSRGAERVVAPERATAAPAAAQEAPSAEPKQPAPPQAPTAVPPAPVADGDRQATPDAGAQLARPGPEAKPKPARPRPKRPERKPSAEPATPATAPKPLPSDPFSDRK
jgi:hypothetical protein